MPRALILTNRSLDEAHGRAQKLRTRKHRFEEQGWSVDVAVIHVSAGIGPFPPLHEIFASLGKARSEPIDVVISISEPIQLHWIGDLISTVVSVPWVVEFRDPMVTKPLVQNSLYRRIPRRVLEWLTIHRADKVLWYDGIQLPENYFETTYPDVPVDKFVKLPGHGVDLREAQTIDPVHFETFTITYAGSFYDGWIDPVSFLRAIAEYVNRYDAEIQVQFYGDWSPKYDKVVSELGIEDIVSNHGWVVWEELLPILAGSDLLLYIGGTEERNKENIPSKLYDYMGARSPILGLIVPEHRAGRFITENELGVAIHPANTTEIVESIQQFRLQNSRKLDLDALDEHSRQRTISMYLDTLQQVIRG